MGKLTTRRQQGRVEARRGSAGGYRTREVAGVIGLTPEQIRRFVQRGLLSPARGAGGEYHFSFQDVVLLRAVKGLLDADVSLRRTFSALTKLRDRLASRGQSLASMRIFADGNTVVVRDGNVLWNAETGQGHFAFSVEQLAGEVRNLAKRNFVDALETDEFDSDDWYNLGLDLEDVDSDKALEAYARSIVLDSGNADAYVNLGRLYQMRGDLKSAKRHYQQALGPAPRHQLALYNLGTVFDELDELDAALGYYRQAPDIPDAHYNLARIFEMRDDQLASRRHMRRYRILVGEISGKSS